MEFDSIEAQAGYLTLPPENQLLYKIISVENLLTSIKDSYLYFNRVDSYSDQHIANADIHDGEQLPRDRPYNATTKFFGNPQKTLEIYNDEFRAKSYACCFSLEESKFIWDHYANDSKQGKVCIVFDFNKLRMAINESLRGKEFFFQHNDDFYRQVLCVNYGLVTYEERITYAYTGHKQRIAHPIQYLYFKDRKEYCSEKELRISLSPISVRRFFVDGVEDPEFPIDVLVDFDFEKAVMSGAILKILVQPSLDVDRIKPQLNKIYHIVSKSSLY